MLGVIVNVSLRWCVVPGEWVLPPVGYDTDMYILPTQLRKGVRHGMLIVRFEYVVWYLQEEEEEELCL